MTHLVRSQQVYRGYVTVSRLTLADAEGGEHQREVVSFGESACVLPYDPVRKVALIVRLARAPLLLAGVEQYLVEAPAGMIEAGEAAEATARREATEETGVELGALEPIAICWPSPGVISERSHMFLAAYGPTDRKGPGGGLAKEHEGISVDEIPLTELWRMHLDGSLRDMKTLTLLLALRTRRPELF